MKFSKVSEQLCRRNLQNQKSGSQDPTPCLRIGGSGRNSMGQFYGQELTPVRVTKRTAYKIDKS